MQYAFGFYQCYRKHLQNCQGRAVVSTLTFEQYLRKAYVAGIRRPSDINVGQNGWRLWRHDRCKGDITDDNSHFTKYSRKFTLISPDGTVHKGDRLVDFCKEHKLGYDNMLRMMAGRLKHSQQWTGSYDHETGNAADDSDTD